MERPAENKKVIAKIEELGLKETFTHEEINKWNDCYYVDLDNCIHTKNEELYKFIWKEYYKF